MPAEYRRAAIRCETLAAPMATRTSRLYAVIMAGGSGTRFWPASRQDRPKQLLAIGADAPLLRATADRIAPLIPPERQFVITAARTVGAVRALLPELPAAQ